MRYRDRLLVNLPRQIEAEPGLSLRVRLATGRGLVPSVQLVPGAWPSGGDEATDAVYPTETSAYAEPLSRRVMGAPHPLNPPAGVEAWVATDCVATGVRPRELLGVGAEPDGAWAVELAPDVPVGGITPWTLAMDVMSPWRGYLVSLYPYQPDSWADASRPMVVLLGDKWRVTLTATETGSADAVVEEWTGDTWEFPRAVALVEGPWFNQWHRIWVQPLGRDEWLVRRWDNPQLGATITTPSPAVIVPAPAEDPDAEPLAGPWPALPMAVMGYTRAIVAMAPMVYAASWSVGPADQVDLGYATASPPEVTLGAWAPPETTASLAVSRGTSGEAWAEGGDAEERFGWRLAATGGPVVATLGPWAGSATTPVADYAQLVCHKSMASDGQVAAELTERLDVGLDGWNLALSEDLGTASLSVALDAPAELAGDWLRPNCRWQWWRDRLTDTGGLVDTAVWFDGLLDGATQRDLYVTADAGYRLRISVRLLTRWRQLASSVYRGMVPLDGLRRSVAYQVLLDSVPLATSEYDIATLDADAQLPSARPGQEPVFEPKPGVELSAVLKDLRDRFGPDDYVGFRGGVLVIRPVSGSAPVARFVRTPDEGAVDQVVLLGGADRSGLGVLAVSADDAEFCNELVVIGRAQEGDPEHDPPVMAYMMDPASWQEPDSALYVGQHRTVVMQQPDIVGLDAAERVARNVWRRLHRFTYTATASGALVAAYPGDSVVVEPGAEPGATLDRYRVVSVSATRSGGGEWLAKYELRLDEPGYTEPELVPDPEPGGGGEA